MTSLHGQPDGPAPPRRLLAVLGVLSATLSFAYALTRGRERFLSDGYSFYVDIAQTLLDGGGLCFGPGEQCAVRGPVYSLVVALFLKLGVLYPGLSLFQAALAGLLPALAYGIGVRVTNRPAALFAAVLTALNPYAVIHGTALQDTGVFNFLTVLAVYLLLRSAESASHWVAAGAGLAIAAATLTAFRFMFFIPGAIVWLAFLNGRSPRAIRGAAWMALPIVIALGGWTLRNVSAVGAPVLTIEGGLNLWVANNATTLAFFPRQSMDQNIKYSFDHLPPERARQIASTGEAEADRIFATWAGEELVADPLRAVLRMARKAGHAFSGQLSPARSGVVQLGFAAVFVPIHLLAALGVWQVRAVRGPRLVLYLLLGSFAVMSALFWAHTSHASHLHPVLFIYAAASGRWLLMRGWREPPALH